MADPQRRIVAAAEHRRQQQDRDGQERVGPGGGEPGPDQARARRRRRPAAPPRPARAGCRASRTWRTTPSPPRRTRAAPTTNSPPVARRRPVPGRRGRHRAPTLIVCQHVCTTYKYCTLFTGKVKEGDRRHDGTGQARSAWPAAGPDRGRDPRRRAEPARRGRSRPRRPCGASPRRSGWPRTRCTPTSRTRPPWSRRWSSACSARSTTTCSPTAPSRGGCRVEALALELRAAADGAPRRGPADDRRPDGRPARPRPERTAPRAPRRRRAQPRRRRPGGLPADRLRVRLDRPGSRRRRRARPAATRIRTHRHPSAAPSPATPAEHYPRAAAAAATLAGYISTEQYLWGLRRVLDGIATSGRLSNQRAAHDAQQDGHSSTSNTPATSPFH